LSRIALYVEDDSDKAVLDGLLRAVRERLREKGVGLRIRRAGDAPKLDRKIGRYAFQELRNPDIVAVFALRDLDAPASQAENRISALGTTVREALSLEQCSRFHAHVAIPQIEAWLLADGNALREVLRTQTDCSLARPEESAGGKPPKEILDELFHKYLDRAYQPTKHGRLIAGAADPGVVAHRCPSFRAFANDLLGCVGLSPLY